MWIGEVEQLGPRRSTAEQALAEERVEGHAGQPLLLLALAGGPARLVVGDHQLAISVELEAVDDAAQADTADLGLELQLDADRRDGGGVLEVEVLADQPLGVGKEGGVGRGSEPQRSEER